MLDTTISDVFSGVDERENLLHRKLKAIKATEKLGCDDCGYPLWSHDKTRENHGGGMYSYNYACPSKTELFG